MQKNIINDENLKKELDDWYDIGFNTDKFRGQFHYINYEDIDFITYKTKEKKIYVRVYIDYGHANKKNAFDYLVENLSNNYWIEPETEDVFKIYKYSN